MRPAVKLNYIRICAVRVGREFLGWAAQRYCYDYYYGRAGKRDESSSFVLIHTKTLPMLPVLLQLPANASALLNYRANQMIPSKRTLCVLYLRCLRRTPRSQVHLLLPRQTAYGFSVLGDFHRCSAGVFRLKTNTRCVCFKWRIFAQYWLENIQSGESGVDTATVEFKNAWDRITGFLTA